MTTYKIKMQNANLIDKYCLNIDMSSHFIHFKFK